MTREGKVQTTSFTARNSSGRMSKMISYSSNGDFMYKYEAEYQKGRLVSQKFYDEEENTLTQTAHFEYDEQGLLQRTIYKNSKGEIDYTSTFAYKLDEKGNWIEKVEFKDGKPYLLTAREMEYYEEE